MPESGATASSTTTAVSEEMVIIEGAQILGGILIAYNIKIGAESVVVKDLLTPGATVVGIPGRPITHAQG